MWQAVRRALVDLEWDAAPPLTEDVVADWAQTVAGLVAVRRALGPLPPDDPIAMLATAATGAVRTPGSAPVAAVSLRAVRAALDGVAGVVAGGTGPDRSRDLAALNQVAYELAHRVRVQVTDPRVGAWLLAGETALDAAIHAPVARSATAAGLAGWQDALAAVQPAPQAAIVRRSVALGHLSILCNATTAVGEAGRPEPCHSRTATVSVATCARWRSPTWRPSATWAGCHPPRPASSRR